MRPVKLSSQVFLELPPVLAHYLEGAKNVWLESTPNDGRLSLQERRGAFLDLEALAVERRQLIQILGFQRARALRYRTGFEQGRRDAARHFALFAENGRLALQAGPVFGQLEGWYMAEPIRFEFDLEARTLYREIVLHGSAEALAHRMIGEDPNECSCWTLAGYLSGHVSEIVGRRVLTLEQTCLARGDDSCRFISRLDPEWGQEAGWARKALEMEPLEAVLARRDEAVANAQKAARLAQGALNRLNRRLFSELLLEDLVAEAECMAAPMQRARQLAAVDAPVLFTGEPGAGRHTLARAIHLSGRRKAAPFEVFDCAAIPQTLQSQELTGFVEGAFAGAVRAYSGALARAHRGTLYVHELTLLAPEAQNALLRAMRDSTVQPAGAPDPIKVDVRVIAATQYDPFDGIARGQVREELYYALAVGRIDIPPLRQRGMDVLRLAERFLVEFRERYDRGQTTFSAALKQALLESAWPGNVRQLRNVVEHALVLGQDRELDVADLPEEVLTMRATPGPAELTEPVILAALRRCHGNRSKAADLLGIGRTTLWRMMKRMAIE